ncbi:MAG: ribonuclease E/G, partial [Nitrospinae bacterium]|nr:ribonuclease E/G [Nitrospinota bacterium]
MIKKMLINAREEEEIRVAIIEDGILQELDIQSTAKEQLKGNIYKAKVVNVEQGLQAAFVDFSGGKPGFLSLGEIQPNYLPEKEKGDRRRIQEVLKRGQELLVQVTKDEIGAKGAALTTYISLPGRYLVLMPGSDSTGISRKIEDEVTRQRLKKIMGQLDVPSDMGLIVRTAGLDRTKTDLGKDLTYLLKLWETIAQKGEEAKATALIYQDLNVIIRAIRDYFTTDIGEVLIDNQEVYQEAKEFFADVMPRFGRRV